MGQKQWASRVGFLLAAAGSAIGLGNLWKFPYLMGRNGGFTFLITYLVFVLILGVPVMMLEMSLGRYTGRDPVQSYKIVLNILLKAILNYLYYTIVTVEKQLRGCSG